MTSFFKSNQLDGNPLEGQPDQLKKLLRGMTSIEGKMRREIERMGFSISQYGKHFKLLFQGDDRYTYTVAKCGIDWRGRLKVASDTCSLLF